MVLSDFLSRQLGDKSDPYQIIPISFNIREVLRRNYQDNAETKFMVQTRSQTKGVKTPIVKRSPNSTSKKEQEIKPIITDDRQTAPNPTKIDNQPDGTDTHINTKYLQSQTYSQLAVRPPPRPPDLLRQTPKYR